ncbi:MAG TPA: hypothetical protein VHM01_08605 [Alphaproteobacteria bacterium]|nr:hypothetical protein [Alphaproteobacteria bacterium]
MLGLPFGRRGFAVWTVLFALAPPAAADPRPFGALAVQDPASEAAAPADATLTAACQAAVRERFGQERLDFGRPGHTARDSTRIVRMDLTAAGQPFRAICTRDGTAGAVEAVVFAAPVDEIGPRVVVLGGPTPEMRPRSDDPGHRLVVRDPSAVPGDDILYQGYGGAYLPGLWVPFDGRFFDSHSFDRSRFLVKRDRPAIEITRGRTDLRFVERRRGSSAPFSSGGIASPAISNFTSKAVRGGSVRLHSGGIASPGIGSFSR